MGILVLGAGLIGSQMARLEVERGEKVVIMDIAPQEEAIGAVVDLARVKVVRGDVLNPFDLARVLREEGIRRVIHTVANPLLTAGAQENPYAAIHLNIMSTANVLEAARTWGLERVVFCSSGVLYYDLMGGQDEGAPFREEAYPRPSTIYATTKLACENLGLNYARWFGVDFVAVRFPAVFGPWRGRGGGRLSLLLRRVLETALAGEEATLPSTLMVEFVYSKDAALGAVLACHAEGLESRVFNIGMGRVYTPQEIARMVEEAIPGARIRVVEREGRRPAGPIGAMDLTRSRQELGYQPRYDMKEAIADYVATWRGWMGGP